jgi:hypothetical protein
MTEKNEKHSDLVVPEGFGAAAEEPEPEVGRDRAGLARAVELDPHQLAGSYCHRVVDGEIVQNGHVVAEIGTGKFLVELEGETGQTPWTLDEMIAARWRFYDTKRDRTRGYAEYLARKKQEAEHGED